MLDVQSKLAALESEIEALMNTREKEIELEKSAASRVEKTTARIETVKAEKSLYESFSECLQAQQDEHDKDQKDLRESLHTLRIKAIGGDTVTGTDIDDIAVIAGFDLDDDVATGESPPEDMSFVET